MAEEIKKKTAPAKEAKTDAAAEKPAGSSVLGETTLAQYSTPGTLAFLLKDLKAQQAIEKLEQLAVELGYDPATGNSYSVKMQFNSEEQWTKVLLGWAGSRGSSSLEKKWNSS